MPAVRRTPVLTIILASYLMIVLDISIVITALPKIHHGLGFSATSLSWVQNAYTLAFGGLLLLGAWRVGFFINVPIGIAMILAAPRYLPESERRPGRLDVAGALTSWLGMTTLV